MVFPPKENTKTHRSSCEIWMVSRASSKAPMGSGASSCGDYLGKRSWGEPGGRGWLVYFSKHISLYSLYIPCFKVLGESTKTCTCIHGSFFECCSLNKDVVVSVGNTSPLVGSLFFFSITCFFPRHPRIYGRKSICITCAIEKLTIHGAP